MHGLDSHTLIQFSGKQPLECLLVLCKELFDHKSNRFEFWEGILREYVQRDIHVQYIDTYS